VAQKVNVSIEIDGTAITPINALSIEQTVNGHHYFELRCPVWERENFLSQTANASIGKEIKVDISPGGNADGPKNYFKGIVTNVRLAKVEASFEEVIYQGYSQSIVMDDGPHEQSFLKKKLKDIVGEVASRYNIDIKADPAYNVAIPYVVQYNESGFQFLSRLAATYGEWFFFDGTRFLFGKAAKENAVDLVFSKNLTHFDLSINVAPSKFKLLGYEYLGHKFPESPSDSAKVGGLDDYGKMAAKASEDVFKFEPVHLVREDFEDKAALDHLAKQRKSAGAGNYVTFSAGGDYHLINAGSVVKILNSLQEPGAGSPKDVDYGEFRIVSLSHYIDGQGSYENRFKAIPSSLEMPPPNPHVREPVCEVQPAEVLDNHDPEKLGRVEVQFWWQKPRGEKTPWIRVAASGAGSDHGSYFVPEKGDQVLVGFEHNNPAKPYVIGSLYHGKAKPSGGNSDPDNNNKELKTKSGNRLLLCDKDGGPAVIIEDGKGKNSITLSLEGSGKITISSPNGDISLSAKNITIAASEKMTLTAKELSETGSDKVEVKAPGGPMTLSASKKMDISGEELEAKGTKGGTILGASASTSKLNGSTVTVEGATMVEVKGGTIKLN